MKILFINSVSGFGSTGKIVDDLANIEGIESLIIYGRKSSRNPKAYKMTNFFGNIIAAINTILFNKNGLSNKRETLRVIENIKKFNPDIIHLHNLHGYYINYEILFEFLKRYNKPVVWTLHDCWAFTGYCPSFDYVNCDKYKTECNKNCVYGFDYPFSLFKQKIDQQYYKKKDLFTSINELIIITPSYWLKERVNESFLGKVKKEVIYNGINLEIFKPSEKKNRKFTVLFVSNIWSKGKGLEEINRLLPLLEKDIRVVIVGKIKPNKLIKERCEIVQQTTNQQELAKLYSESHLFINPTLNEVFGLVNVEALACGTPVIAYNTGGTPEIIDDYSGIIINKYDVESLATTINNLYYNNYFKEDKCISRAKQFSKDKMINNYHLLYKEIMKKHL